jgi:hypothetical protein
MTSLEEEKLMWVLILIFVSGSASYVEFTSEKQCKNAQDQISQEIARMEKTRDAVPVELLSRLDARLVWSENRRHASADISR